MESNLTLSEIKTDLQIIMKKASLLGKESSDPQRKILHETSADVLQCLISAYSHAEGISEENSNL